MQQAILKRLRTEIDKLKNERTEIIANSKQNQIVQNRIQAAVISIIQATTFEKMIHVVTHELPELLDVDFITLAIEANADAPKRVPVRGVYVLAPGAIDAALGPEKHARLRSHIAGEEAFFGDVARFVKSDVLMRLQVVVRLARRRDVLRRARSRGLRPGAWRPSCCSSWPRCWRTPSAPGSTCRSEAGVRMQLALG